MSVRDAEPGDVYVDARGKLWRVVGVCHEPSVTVQEIEFTPMQSARQQGGGVSGLMWNGFTRIFRPEVRKS